jgi:two-component sensor histidine kinase
MIARFRYWQYHTPPPALGYSAALLLAAAAQVARIPLHPPTLMPHISYVPFIVLSAALGGFGPGLLSTTVCVLESVYFATEPVGAFAVGDSRLWGGVAALAFTGLVTSGLFGSLKEAWRLADAAASAEVRLARERETRQRMLESIVQNSPAAIALLRGPEFTFAMVNPAYQALVPGEPMVGRTVASIWPAGASLVLPLLNVVRDAETVYHAAGFAFPVSPGQGLPAADRYFDFSYVPLAETGGQNGVDILVVALETTEQKQAEADLRAAYSQLAAIHANAPVILLVIDEQLQVQQANELAARFAGADALAMSGLPPGGVLGCLHALTDPQGCGHSPSCGRCPLRSAISDTLASGTRHDGIEAWLPKNIEGAIERRCLLVTTTALQSEGHHQVLVCAQDITERKQAEDALKQTVGQLESALAEKTVLLQEVHHRVKNNLAVTASLLSLKADACGPEARMALEESQQRIHSIALVHEHLYASERLDRVDFGGYARDLAVGVHSAFAGEHRGIALDLALDSIDLGIERAVPCALILNELLSNAFKYAFPGGRTGRIRVSFHRPESGYCELAVEDDGIGLPAGALGGQDKSLGLRIVSILTRQLDGSLEPRDGPGTRIVLRFPISA